MTGSRFGMVRKTPLEPPGLAVPGESINLTQLRVFGNVDPTEIDLEPRSDKIDPNHQKIQSLELGADTVDSNHQNTKIKIVAARKLLTFREQHLIVQFWSLRVVGRHQLLETLDQPFGIGANDVGLSLYRRDSESKSFVVKEERKEEDSSPVTRVFRRGLTEWTSDLDNYTPRQFPQKEGAIRCNLHGYLAIPVFDSNTHICVGVLELLTASKYNNYAYEVQQFHRALKTQNLTSPEGDSPDLYIENPISPQEFDSPDLYADEDDDDSSINPPKRRKIHGLYGEVRDGNTDHYCTQRQEEMVTSPDVYRIDEDNHGFTGELLRHANQSKIYNVVHNFDFKGQSGSLQYWEYKQVGHKGHLKVADQLFVSTRNQKGLQKYRKSCLNKIVILESDTKVDEEWFVGLAAQKRVACQRTCGDPDQILGQLVVPVFSYQGADEKFIGVIELTTFFPKECYDEDFNQIQSLLKDENLATKIYGEDDVYRRKP